MSSGSLFCPRFFFGCQTGTFFFLVPGFFGCLSDGKLFPCGRDNFGDYVDVA